MEDRKDNKYLRFAGCREEARKRKQSLDASYFTRYNKTWFDL